MDSGVAAILGASIGGGVGLISIFIQAYLEDKRWTKERRELAYTEALNGFSILMSSYNEDEKTVSVESLQYVLSSLSKLAIYSSIRQKPKITEAYLLLTDLNVDDPMVVFRKGWSLVMQAARDELVEAKNLPHDSIQESEH